MLLILQQLKQGTAEQVRERSISTYNEFATYKETVAILNRMARLQKGVAIIGVVPENRGPWQPNAKVRLYKYVEGSSNGDEN